MDADPKFFWKVSLALLVLFFCSSLLVAFSHMRILSFVVLFLTFDSFYLVGAFSLVMLVLSSFALALFATKQMIGLKLALVVSAIESVFGLFLLADTYLYLSAISFASFMQFAFITFGVVAFYCALKSKPVFVAGK